MKKIYIVNDLGKVFLFREKPSRPVFLVTHANFGGHPTYYSSQDLNDAEGENSGCEQTIKELEDAFQIDCWIDCHNSCRGVELTGVTASILGLHKIDAATPVEITLPSIVLGKAR